MQSALAIEPPMPEEDVNCTECGSQHVRRDYNRAEVVCLACGLVLEESMIDQGPEWRAFDMQQEASLARAGAPTTYRLPDKGLSTQISTSNTDYYGRRLSNSNQAQLYRLRKWQRRATTSKSGERNLSEALREMEKLAARLHLPRHLMERAAFTYRQAVHQGLIMGRSIEAVSAAVMYASCREGGVPRTLEEIARHSRISRKEIGRAYRALIKELKIQPRLPEPKDFVPRLISKLKLSPEVERRSMSLLHETENVELTNATPISRAAAAVYICSVLMCERRKQKEVAKAAGLTEVTVRSRYKEISNKLGLTVPT